MLATWSPIYSSPIARPVARRTAWLTGFSPWLPVQWESRWEESAKNSLWQILRVVDARSYLQCSLAQRTDQSPAIHAHGSSVRTCRARATAVLCYCEGSTATHENFHLTSSFHFILFSIISHSYLLIHPIRLQLIHSCSSFQTASFVFLGTPVVFPLVCPPERNTLHLELVPAWFMIHTGGD